MGLRVVAEPSRVVRRVDRPATGPGSAAARRRDATRGRAPVPDLVRGLSRGARHGRHGPDRPGPDARRQPAHARRRHGDEQRGDPRGLDRRPAGAQARGPDAGLPLDPPGVQRSRVPRRTWRAPFEVTAPRASRPRGPSPRASGDGCGRSTTSRSPSATWSPPSCSSSPGASRPWCCGCSSSAPRARAWTPRRYNQLFTMHGTTMMFLFVIPFIEALANLRPAADAGDPRPAVSRGSLRCRSGPTCSAASSSTRASCCARAGRRLVRLRAAHQRAALLAGARDRLLGPRAVGRRDRGASARRRS